MMKCPRNNSQQSSSSNRSSSFHYLLWISLLDVFTGVSAFNVDIEDVRIIKGREGSLFGSTLNFYPKDPNPRASDDITLLVSAPNQEIQGLSEISLGAIYECVDVLEGNSPVCTESHLADDKNLNDASVVEHFASAVAVSENGAKVICSPQWQDTRTADDPRQSFTWMPGRCSVLNQGRQDEYHPYFDESARWQSAIQEVNKTWLYVEGLAAYGVSVDAGMQKYFVSGAPNVLEGEGSVLLADIETKKVTKSFLQITYNIDTTAFGYLGYAVKFGRFCSTTDAVCIAASAPNLNRVGVIKLYEYTNGKIEEIHLIEGTQAWSYFGYTLAACDVNGDDLDELLVGAPHQTDTTDAMEGLDQGAVHVYSRKSLQENLQSQIVLHGNKKAFARFGTSVQCIGDINLDGFNDIAVGAPGEDGGKGTVNIYLGSAGGLTNSPAQSISGSSIPVPSPGLGYAISEQQLITDSKYPVFAVSSIEEDMALVFFTRPIVDTVATLDVTPNPIDTEAACLTDTSISGACIDVKLCLQGQIRGGGDFDSQYGFQLELDTSKATDEWKRALFKLDDGSYSATVSEVVPSGECQTYKAVIQEAQLNQDRFSPLFVVAHFELAIVSEGKTTPVLDAQKPQNITVTATFVNECGTDNQCDVNLNVTGSLSYSGNEEGLDMLVANETKELLVELVVGNTKETSYWTVVEIEIDSASIPYSRPTPNSDAGVKCKNEELPATDMKSKVICDYYTPLHTGRTFKVGAAFLTDPMPLDQAEVKVKVNVRPNDELTSKEIDESNNEVEFVTAVQIIADVTVHGVSEPSEVTLEEAYQISLTTKADVSEGYTIPDHDLVELNVSHRILIQNEGPSLLLPTTVRVSVPFLLPDASLLVHGARVTLTTDENKVLTCRDLVDFDTNTGRVVTTPSSSSKTTSIPTDNGGGQVTTTSDPSSGTTTDGIPYPVPNKRRRRRRRGVATRKRRSTETDIGSNVYTQSCSIDIQYCQIYECDLSNGLAPERYAQVDVNLMLDRAHIPIPKDFDTYYYLIHTEVVQPEHELFPRWEKPSVIESLTKFHLVHTGGEINIWIIIGAIIGGLVVITIVALVLWKSGFFKRDKHQQVAQWKRESQRRSRASSSGAKGGDD